MHARCYPVIQQLYMGKRNYVEITVKLCIFAKVTVVNYSNVS